MNEPILVIMAAGMGSRYGGLKQIDQIDQQGHIIMDFSIYDAVRAGFKKVLFVIKKENESIFKEKIGKRMSADVEIGYAFQELSNLPEGCEVPEGRVKPWGTGHAVLSCYDVIDGPFAVINADDYYGPEAFQMIYDYLTTHEDDAKYRYMMVGYRLGNTLTENGHVSRGVCSVDKQERLTGITERTYIVATDTGAAYSEDNGESLIPISVEETVSMNMWGFTRSFMDELKNHFEDFLKEGVPTNPMKAEYFLPAVVSELLKSEKAVVTVLQSADRWYGVTYKEDKAAVVNAIQQLKDNGVYPELLWTNDNK